MRFTQTREFPTDEQDRLTTPLIRAARLVCTDIAQAWQKRRYQPAFIARLNQAEADAATAQVWVEFAVLCDYIDAETVQELHHSYQEILADLARLIEHSAAWVISTDVEV